MFRMFDKNNNNSISRDEFLIGLDDLDLNLSNQEKILLLE
jgi:hypothetical protein